MKPQRFKNILYRDKVLQPRVCAELAYNGSNGKANAYIPLFEMGGVLHGRVVLVGNYLRDLFTETINEGWTFDGLRMSVRNPGYMSRANGA